MNTSKIRRGDMFYADFAPVVGSEQSGSRPVIVVQNDIGNKHSPTIIVVPLTRQPKKPLPTHVVIPKSNGLDRDSFVLTEQVRTLDRSRFSKYMGHISDEIMCKVNMALVSSIMTLPAFIQSLTASGTTPETIQAWLKQADLSGAKSFHDNFNEFQSQLKV